MGTGGKFLRKIRAQIVDRPTGFVWVEERVAASGYPASKRQLAWLAEQGINAVLTLTEDSLPAEIVDGLSMQFEHIPMKDHGIPSAGDLERGATFIRSQVGAGRRVLVHCLAGEGRTGCVLAAYLVTERRVAPQEAMKMLRDIKREFVERKQEQAVYDYASSLARMPSA